MEKVVVVILNYMNYMETIQCVDSILSQKDVRFEIVIVDNGSSNESCKELRTRYSKNRLIHILKNKRNYGFAKGNNVGINYARQKLSAEFVLLLNSDTELIQSDCIHILISTYKIDVAVISGKIIQKRGLIQERYFEYVEFPDTFFWYLYLIFDYYGLLSLSKKISRVLRKVNKTEILHGSCFMLTPSFFKHYNILYPKTFLYSEEILLYIYCRKAGLAQARAEEAEILHKGKQSSKYLYGNKESVKRKHQIASYKYVVWESFKVYVKERVSNITNKILKR